MAKSNEINVLLLRSGTTEWDKAGRLSGSCDLPLCEAGCRDAEDLAAKLASTPLSVIYCGPDDACVATAEAVARVTGSKVKPIADLGEIGLGLWEGLLGSEIEEKYPTAYRQWIEDPASVNAPEGEPMLEAEDRILGAVAKALDKVRDGSGGVALVLRPLALGVVRCWLAGEAVSNLWSMVKGCPSAEWRVVPRAMLRQVRDESRAGA